MNKRTKIVCTLGPASNDKETLVKMFDAGMNVARFNFSHGSHEEQGERMDMIRGINKELNKNVAILLDTKGPEIRTHLFSEKKVEVLKGATVRIAMEEVTGNSELFSITYPGLYDDIEVGGTVLIDDGYLELEVVDKDSDKKHLVCEAINTHTIKDRRGVNVPNVVLHMPFISDKDKADIEFGCDQNVDFIAASFVRRRSDVLEIKEILKAKGKEGQIQIIAKIENVEGVDNLDEIIDECDGIMVARGDLGVEVPAWDVPAIQQRIIESCHVLGKIAITATQMLESMQQNPRPTRAEVSDVANAVLFGSDAVMLSGESAAGNYPVQSVKMMANICLRAEKELDYGLLMDRALEVVEEENKEVNATVFSVTQAAQYLDAKAIVIPTTSGLTAQLISKFRACAPVIALTESKSVATSLALNWGIKAVVVKLPNNAKELYELCQKEAITECDLEKGDIIAISSGYVLGEVGSTNSMTIKTV